MDSTQACSLLVSIIAVVAGGVMAWRVLQRQRQVPLEAKERQLRRFTKRRLLISALLGVVGVMLYLGEFVLRDTLTKPEHAGAFGWFWLAVVAILVWLLGLALADIYTIVVAQLSEYYKRKE